MGTQHPHVLSNIVLIGAAGTVGSHILRTLLQDETQFSITTPLRPASSSKFPNNNNKIKTVRTEFTHANLVTVFRGHDAVISATGVQTFADQLVWIRAAHEAGVSRFILNDYGNSIENQIGLPELEQFRTLKREALSLAKEIACQQANSDKYNDNGFSWSSLATGNFIDYSIKKYPVFGFDVRGKSARLVDDGTERLSAVTLADIGLAIRGILKRPRETRNRYLHIRSVETCQVEILTALEHHTGTKWDVRYEDSQVMYERGKEAFSKGQKSGMLDILVTQLFQKGGDRSIIVTREKSDNELLGVREKDINTVVADILATFDTA